MKKKDKNMKELKKYYSYFYKGGDGMHRKNRYNMDDSSSGLDKEFNLCYNYNEDMEELIND